MCNSFNIVDICQTSRTIEDQFGGWYYFYHNEHMGLIWMKVALYESSFGSEYRGAVLPNAHGALVLHKVFRIMPRRFCYFCAIKKGLKSTTLQYFGFCFMSFLWIDTCYIFKTYPKALKLNVKREHLFKRLSTRSFFYKRQIDN